MKAGHTEEYVDGTLAAPWPQLDGVRPKTSPSLVDDGRSEEDREGRGGAKSNIPILVFIIFGAHVAINAILLSGNYPTCSENVG